MNALHDSENAKTRKGSGRLPARFATLYFRYRWWSAAAVVAFTALSLYGVSRLTINDSLVELFKAGNEDYRQLQQFFDDFGADDQECVVVLHGEQLFSRRSVGVLRKLVAELKSTPGVASVFSVLEVRQRAKVFRRVMVPVLPDDDAEPSAFELAARRLQKHPVAHGRLVSPDGRTTLIVVRLSSRAVSTREIQPVIGRLRQAIQRHTEGTGLHASVTGVPEIRVEIYRCVQRDHIKFAGLGFLVSLLIATALFRRPAPVLVSCLPPAVGALWALGSLGLAHEPLNTLNSILPTLVFVVGFADSVHLTVHIRHGQDQGLDPRQAATASLCELFVPCALTSFSTAVGFGSLSVAQIDAVQRLGIACAAGAVLNFVAVILLVPLLASSPLGSRLASAPARRSLEPWLRAVLERYVGWVTRWSRPVAAIGIALTVALLALATRLEPDNDIRNGMPLGSPSYESLEHCDRAFGGAIFSYAVVQWPEGLDLDSAEVLRVLVAVHRVLNEAPDLGTPFSVLNVLASLPPGNGRLPAAVKYLDRAPPYVIRRLVRRDLRKAVVDIQTPDRGARRLTPVYEAIDAAFRKIERQHPGFRIHLTGSTVVASRNVNQITVDLCRSLGVATVVIFGTIMCVFRSVRIGLISVLPNVVPLASAAAVMVFQGGDLHVPGAIVFSICLGIAVDDTIHFISRFRLEWDPALPPEVAIRRAVAKVGSALVVTTLTLLGGFGTGLFSALPALHTFSILSCVALIAALGADITILPALLMWYGTSKPRRRPEATGS